MKTSLFKDIVEISAQYEDSGHYDRAKALLEDLAKLDPKLPGLKEKLEALENKVFDSQEVKVPFDASSGWVPVNASVAMGRPVRVDVEGEYTFKYAAELTHAVHAISGEPFSVSSWSFPWEISGVLHLKTRSPFLRNVLWITRWRWITTEALQDVRAIQARCAHTHSHAIECRSGRVGDLASLKAFNAAE